MSAFWAKRNDVLHLWELRDNGEDYMSVCCLLASKEELVPAGIISESKMCGACHAHQHDAGEALIEPIPPHPRILNDAIRVVYEEREHSRGHPRPGYELLAKVWSAYLGMDVSLDRTIHMLVLLKVCRDTMRAEHDNLVDIAGYAENLARCRE